MGNRAFQRLSTMLNLAGQAAPGQIDITAVQSVLDLGRQAEESLGRVYRYYKRVACTAAGNPNATAVGLASAANWDTVISLGDATNQLTGLVPDFETDSSFFLGAGITAVTGANLTDATLYERFSQLGNMEIPIFFVGDSRTGRGIPGTGTLANSYGAAYGAYGPPPFQLKFFAGGSLRFEANVGADQDVDVFVEILAAPRGVLPRM